MMDNFPFSATTTFCMTDICRLTWQAVTILCPLDQHRQVCLMTPKSWWDCAPAGKWLKHWRHQSPHLHNAAKGRDNSCACSTAGQLNLIPLLGWASWCSWCSLTSICTQTTESFLPLVSNLQTHSAPWVTLWIIIMPQTGFYLRNR